MAGLYPNDEEITMFGEKLRFPSLGEDGKFTNGSFTDPKQKPSFIPAETINLILDNLNEVIKWAGLDPNNTSQTQLKEALDKKAKSIINPYYIQFANESGSFLEDEEPSLYFKNNFDIDTIWQLLFNKESVFFRTEGTEANKKRTNGFQNAFIGDFNIDFGYSAKYRATKTTAAETCFQTAAMQSIHGFIYAVTGDVVYDPSVKGWIFERAYYSNNNGMENTVRNRLIRIYRKIG